MKEYGPKRMVYPVKQYTPLVTSGRTVKEAMHKAHLAEAKFYSRGADGKPRYTKW